MLKKGSLYNHPRYGLYRAYTSRILKPVVQTEVCLVVVIINDGWEEV